MSRLSLVVVLMLPLLSGFVAAQALVSVPPLPLDCHPYWDLYNGTADTGFDFSALDLGGGQYLWVATHPDLDYFEWGTAWYLSQGHYSYWNEVKAIGGTLDWDEGEGGYVKTSPSPHPRTLRPPSP